MFAFSNFMAMIGVRRSAWSLSYYNREAIFHSQLIVEAVICISWKFSFIMIVLLVLIAERSNQWVWKVGCVGSIRMLLLKICMCRFTGIVQNFLWIEITKGKNTSLPSASGRVGIHATVVVTCLEIMTSQIIWMFSDAIMHFHWINVRCTRVNISILSWAVTCLLWD